MSSEKIIFLEVVMENTKLREKIKKIGVPHWALAERIGISEFTFCRWLRKDLVGERLDRVLKAIADMEAHR